MNLRPVRSRREDLTLDLMPLIDVVFLLLIFFLITTSFTRPRQEHKIPINLPTGVSGAEASTEEPVVIVVTAEGDVRFEETELQGDTLEAKLKSLKAAKPDASIMLRGDTEASHGRVVETLDAIKASGFDKVNLVIKKKTAP